MSFNKYKVKPLQVFTSSLWNSVMDELNNLELGVGTIKDIEIKVEELYDADLSTDQFISLDVGGYKYVCVVAIADEPTTFKVEYSFDGVHWFTYYESEYPETQYIDIFISIARYIMLRSYAVEGSTGKVTLVIGAKP